MSVFALGSHVTMDRVAVYGNFTNRQEGATTAPCAVVVPQEIQLVRVGVAQAVLVGVPKLAF